MMFGIKKENGRPYLFAATAAVVILVSASLLLLFPPGEWCPPGEECTTHDIPPIGTAPCEASGGVWNECGSPCMDAPEGTVCIQVCRAQCEWYAGDAHYISSGDYSRMPGFGCMTQPNGILVCWLPG